MSSVGSSYFKVPKDIENRKVILLAPMLATGGSVADAITQLKEVGAKNIKMHFNR